MRKEEAKKRRERGKERGERREERGDPPILINIYLLRRRNDDLGIKRKGRGNRVKREKGVREGEGRKRARVSEGKRMRNKIRRGKVKGESRGRGTRKKNKKRRGRDLFNHCPVLYAKAEGERGGGGREYT